MPELELRPRLRRRLAAALLACACNDPGDPAGGPPASDGPPASEGTSTGDGAGPSTSAPAPTTTADPGTTDPGTTTTGTTTADPGTTAAADAGPVPGETCGDGVVDPGETCDLGWAANDDAGACTLACQQAVCGDGLVWQGQEACDDGPANNDTLYNACTTACARGPRCGDGVVQAPFEECDHGGDGGEAPAGEVACTACRHAARLVFLSSAAWPAGELGGLPGADLKCRALAQAAGFDNSSAFRAWLSAGQDGPASRFTPGPADLPYALPDGTRLADDLDDLLNGGPTPGITRTETHATLPDTAVWTNTAPDGHPFDPDADCEGWTSSSALLKSRVGRSSAPPAETQAWAQEQQWTTFKSFSCNLAARMYCFEQ